MTHKWHKLDGGASAWLGLLAALGLGFALLPLMQGEMFFYWDNAQQHYAQTEFLHKALRSGSIPHWWPHVGSGMPIVAEGQAAHFHPIRLLLALILPTPFAFMGEIGLYLAVGGVSTFLFLREFRLRPVACFVGGLCQVFGSFSVVFVRNMALHRSLCLLPLAMYFAERYVRRRSLRAGLGMSAVVGLQLLAGHPAPAWVTLVATTSYVVCRLIQRAWHTNLSMRPLTRELTLVTIQWGFFVVLGFGMGAIQVLPTLLHVEHSIRQGGLNSEYALNTLTAEIKSLPQLLFPYAYTQGDWIDMPTPSGRTFQFNGVPSAGIYAGVLPVLLVILALWWHRHWPDPTWPLAICGLVGTAIALGGSTPLFSALRSLPGMSALRYPSRFLMWSSFCLACLAALGLHRLLARTRLTRSTTKDSFPFLVWGASGLALASAFWIRRPNFRSGVLISLVLMVVALALVWSILVAPRSYRTLLVVLATLFVLGDLWLFRAESGYAPSVAIHDALDPPPLVKFLKADPDQFRVLSLVPDDILLNRNEDLREFLQADLCTIWGIESADVWLSLMLKRYYAVREGIVWELLHSPESAPKLAGFLGTLNVKYVIAPPDTMLSGWEKVYNTDRAATWRNPGFLPRAFLVGEVVSEPTGVRQEWNERSVKRLRSYFGQVADSWSRRADSQIVDHILSLPIDYRNVAIISAEDMPNLSGLDPQAEVYLEVQGPDTMRFSVLSREAALLVISTNYYPGWSATVNGERAHLYRTNWVGMGVKVPLGRTEVSLRFVTPGYRLGLLLTLVSLAVFSFGLLAAAKGMNGRLSKAMR